MTSFNGTFTHRIQIDFTKPEKFDAAFFEQFNKSISPADTLADIAVFITHVYGYNLMDDFMEGIGNLEEMGVKITEIEQESEVEVKID